MNIFGNISKIDGNKLVVDIGNLADWELTELNKLPSVQMTIDDDRTITIDQRKKACAMMNDISDYTGYTPLETEQMMKIRFMCLQDNPREFSLSNCNRELAKDFIEFLINFCLMEKIPFTTKVFDEIQQSYQLRVQLLRNRICYVCGKPNADVDHVDTIGAGRNRRSTNQVGMHAWTLCRACHQRRHKMGVKSFAQAYQIKPVKLTAELIDYLNLANKGASQ